MNDIRLALVRFLALRFNDIELSISRALQRKGVKKGKNRGRYEVECRMEAHMRVYDEAMCLLDAGIPPEAIWDTPVERKTTISFSKRVFYWSMDACKKTLRKHAVDKHVSQADAMSQACDPMTPIGILIANEEAARLDERLPAQVCREMLDLPAKQKLAVFLMLRQILADLLPFDDFIELAIEVRAFHSEFDGPDDKNLSKNANRGVSRLRKALLTGIILLGSLLGSTAAAPAVDGHVNQLARVARDSGHVNLVAGHVNAVDGHVN